jgi:hypothetical protein
MAELHAVPLAGRTLSPAGASLVLAQVADPGGGTDPPSYIAPLHVHHAEDEAWYVMARAWVADPSGKVGGDQGR